MNTRIWQVEWSVAQKPSIYYGAGPSTEIVRRQFFGTPDDADAFKKSLVAAAALLGTGVNPVISEAEVFQGDKL